MPILYSMQLSLEPFAPENRANLIYDFKTNFRKL